MPADRGARLTIPAVAAVVIAGTVLTGLVVSRIPVDRPVVATALSALPADVTTASVTDWAAVRARVGPDLAQAREADLTAGSLLADLVDVMERRYGWSVQDAQWEALGQGPEGAVAVLQLGGDVDMAALGPRLRDLGYDAPEGHGGVWSGGEAVVAAVDPGLTPMLGFIEVRAHQHQVVLSDQRSYAERAVEVLAGRRRSLGSHLGVRSVAAQLREALVATVHRDGHGCEVMGFGTADRDEQVAARRRLRSVGGVGRHDAVALAYEGGDLVLALHVPDPVAREAERRGRLATGEAPAQGGTFESRFAVVDVAGRGADVVLRLRPHEEDARLLSDFGGGALLPAVCGDPAA